jgi:nucleoside 2-deoxyribosyltransferase
MKFYLAGPMSGMPDHNYPTFARVQRALQELGFEVISPHNLNAWAPAALARGEDEPTVRRACMRTDLRALLDCDGIFLLDGWERSRGAKIELDLALGLGLEVRLVREILDLQ